jgi:hypothetical protein
MLFHEPVPRTRPTTRQPIKLPISTVKKTPDPQFPILLECLLTLAAAATDQSILFPYSVLPPQAIRRGCLISVPFTLLLLATTLCLHLLPQGPPPRSSEARRSTGVPDSARPPPPPAGPCARTGIEAATRGSSRFVCCIEIHHRSSYPSFVFIYMIFYEDDVCGWTAD